VLLDVLDGVLPARPGISMMDQPSLNTHGGQLGPQVEASFFRGAYLFYRPAHVTGNEELQELFSSIKGCTVPSMANS